MLNLNITPKQLTDLTTKLRKARFEYLVEESTGVLEDTWYQENKRLTYWPTGDLDDTFFKLTPPEEQILTNFQDKHNFKTLGIGSGRITITKSNTPYAVKLARYGMTARLGDGKDSNQIEIQRWKSINDHPLAPIYVWDKHYHWLIQPKAKLLETQPRTKQKKIIQQIQTELQPYTDQISNSSDILKENIGKINNQWKLLDYGKPLKENDQMYGIFPTVIDQYK